MAASTEADALRALSRDPAPSAVLLDPASLGAQTARIFRQLPSLNDVPVFIVSSSSADAVYHKADGVQGYVRKAVALDHLMLLLDGSTVAAPRSAGSTCAA